MKGFMRQRGDAWELRVHLGKDPVTGKQRSDTRTVRGGKREAQRTLNAMVKDATRDLSIRTNATVGELIEAWFAPAADDFPPKAVKETRGLIDRNLLPAIAQSMPSGPTGRGRRRQRRHRASPDHRSPAPSSSAWPSCSLPTTWKVLSSCTSTCDPSSRVTSTS